MVNLHEMTIHFMKLLGTTFFFCQSFRFWFLNINLLDYEQHQQNQGWLNYTSAPGTWGKPTELVPHTPWRLNGLSRKPQKGHWVRLRALCTWNKSLVSFCIRTEQTFPLFVFKPLLNLRLLCIHMPLSDLNETKSYRQELVCFLLGIIF